MPSSTPPSTERWIPAAFVGGMLAVVAANAALVYFALQSWSGVAVPRAFERGVGYNQVLAAAAREDDLGWQAAIEVRGGGGGDSGTILIQLNDRYGRPLEAGVVAELSRPLEATAPVSVALLPVGVGRSQAAFDSLRPGQWDVRVTVHRGPDRLHLHRRVFVP